jgi:hypothetical protein
MASDEQPAWLMRHGDGSVLLVAVQPGARRSELTGLHDGALRVRVAAPPIEGRANDALCEWLARQLHCARRQVRVLRGDTSRRKQVAVDLPPPQVRPCIDALLEQAQSPPARSGAAGAPPTRSPS